MSKRNELEVLKIVFLEGWHLLFGECAEEEPVEGVREGKSG